MKRNRLRNAPDRPNPIWPTSGWRPRPFPMSDDTTAKQDGTTDGNIPAVRHRQQGRRARLIILFFAAIAISATIAWHFLLSSCQGGMYGCLSLRAKIEFWAL